MMPYLDGFDRQILGGDPKQLPYMVAKDCTHAKSAMDWALELDGNAELKVVVLLDQYRMVPQIGEICSSFFYNGELRHIRKDDGCKHVYFYNTKGIMHPVNSFLLKAGDTKCCQMLYRQILSRNPNSNVQLLAYYRAQARDIQRVLPNANVCCIDGFQGEEADEVILATTSRGGKPSNFIHDARRLNVAISRARNNLYIVGNITAMENALHWSLVIEKCDKRFTKFC